MAAPKAAPLLTCLGNTGQPKRCIVSICCLATQGSKGKYSNCCSQECFAANFAAAKEPQVLNSFIIVQN
jgi:hypothetical protein